MKNTYAEKLKKTLNVEFTHTLGVPSFQFLIFKKQFSITQYEEIIISFILNNAIDFDLSASFISKQFEKLGFDNVYRPKLSEAIKSLSKKGLIILPSEDVIKENQKKHKGYTVNVEPIFIELGKISDLICENTNKKKVYTKEDFIINKQMDELLEAI